MPPVVRGALVLALLLAGCAGGERTGDESATTPSVPTRIVIDGASADWRSVPVRHADPIGDAGVSAGDPTLDLGRLWLAHDDEHLFLRLETSTTMNLSENNELSLALDTDADPTTGADTLGLGAEAIWTFGARRGTVHRRNTATEIGHAALNLTALPTVRANAFEIALDRSARPAGAPLFRSDTLRVALASPQDRLPDTGSLTYAFAPADLDPLPMPALSPPDDALRLVAFNVLQDRLFEGEARASYRRVLRGLEGDVLGLSEVYDHTAAEAKARVANLTGSDASAWHAAKEGRDLVMLSRHPIRDAYAIPGYQDEEGAYESGAFLLDTQSALGAPLVVILAHPPCCNYADAQPSRDAQRQQVVDGIAAFLRDTKQGNGPFDVPRRTPIVVMGDMNFVGDPQQPETIRTGQIVNNERFGPSAAPDWDGTALLDTNPRQTGSPHHATWIADESSFPPGRLDYAYVTDSVLEVAGKYVLRTRTLTPARRRVLGVEANDTATTSDHLPLVIDVRARAEND